MITTADRLELLAAKAQRIREELCAFNQARDSAMSNAERIAIEVVYELRVAASEERRLQEARDKRLNETCPASRYDHDEQVREAHFEAAGVPAHCSACGGAVDRADPFLIGSEPGAFCSAECRNSVLEANSRRSDERMAATPPLPRPEGDGIVK